MFSSKDVNSAKLRLSALLLTIVVSGMFTACGGAADEQPAADNTDGQDLNAAAVVEGVEVPAADAPPLESIETYWARISAQNLEGAWPLLDKQYQQRHFNNSLVRFKADIRSSQFCSVTIDTVHLDSTIDKLNAVVNARLWIERGDSCLRNRDNFSIDMTRDTPEQHWRIRNISVR